MRPIYSAVVALLLLSIGCAPDRPAPLDPDDLRRYFPNRENSVRKYISEGSSDVTYTIKRRREDNGELLFDVEILENDEPSPTESYRVTPGFASQVSSGDVKYNPAIVFLKIVKEQGDKSWAEKHDGANYKYRMLDNKEYKIDGVVYNCIGSECLITQANIGIAFRKWYAIDVGLVAYETQFQGGDWIEYIMEKP